MSVELSIAASCGAGKVANSLASDSDDHGLVVVRVSVFRRYLRLAFQPNLTAAGRGSKSALIALFTNYFLVETTR